MNFFTSENQVQHGGRKARRGGRRRRFPQAVSLLATLFLFGSACSRVQDPVYTGLDSPGGRGPAASTRTSTGSGDHAAAESVSAGAAESALASGGSGTGETGVSAGQGEKVARYVLDPDYSTVKSLHREDRDKLCLLTFDNVPNGQTLEIAAALEAQGARGLFFINGNNLEEESARDAVKQLYQKGHSIGCNGRRGLNLKGLSEEEQRAEIQDNIKQIQTIIGASPRFYRPPQGEMDETTRKICRELSLIPMGWSFSYDWMDSYQDKDSLTQVILNDTPLLSGMNILFHDLPWTRDAMPEILKGLQSKGFRFVDPAELTMSKEAPRNIEYHEVESNLASESVDSSQEGSSESAVNPSAVPAPTVKETPSSAS